MLTSVSYIAPLPDRVTMWPPKSTDWWITYPNRMLSPGEGGGVVSCAKAGGPAIVPTVNTMAEIARAVPRIFTKSDFEIIALIIACHPHLKKTKLAFEPWICT